MPCNNVFITLIGTRPILPILLSSCPWYCNGTTDGLRSYHLYISVCWLCLRSVLWQGGEAPPHSNGNWKIVRPSVELPSKDDYPMTSVKISGEKRCWKLCNFQTPGHPHSHGSWDKSKNPYPLRIHIMFYEATAYFQYQKFIYDIHIQMMDIQHFFKTNTTDILFNSFRV